jgi:Zn-dependent protease
LPADLTARIWRIAIVALPIIIAITLHEAAHGYVARYFGDNTAAEQGRVTLNPLRHIDPFGTVILPMLLVLVGTGFVFGYAKPVPVNFANLRHPKRDMVWVAIAGPAMNLLLAAISVLLIFIPVPGGSALEGSLLQLLWASVNINLVLAVLNMIPLPPLDGGRVLTGLLPQPLSRSVAQIDRFGMLPVLVIFIFLPQLGVNAFQWLVAGPVAWLERPIMALLGLHNG